MAGEPLGQMEGDVTFSADGQVLKGKINVDSISSLDMTMKNGTNFTGSINTSGEAGTVSVKMDTSSIWTLTGDSYVSSFEGDISNVVSNGTSALCGRSCTILKVYIFKFTQRQKHISKYYLRCVFCIEIIWFRMYLIIYMKK